MRLRVSGCRCTFANTFASESETWGIRMNTRFAASKMVVSALIGLVLVFLCATMAHAQSAGTGAIAGTVTDPSGGAVANATVTATSLATNQTRTAVTGSAGDYKFNLLPPGEYRLRFSAA